MNIDEARAMLSQPGGMLEVTEEPVRGRPRKVFKTRERSLREKLINATTAHADKPFLVDGERRLTYGEFGQLCFGAARVLTQDYGMAKGDRLAILAYNRPEWLAALFGATSAGAVGVGLNGWWAEEELEYGLRDSGSRYLIVDEDLYPRVQPILAKIDSLETVFYIGDNPPAGTVPMAALEVPHAEPPTVPIEEDDPWVLLYTSGTTGRSKGCITTHRGTIAQVQLIIFNFLANAMVKGENPLGDEGGDLPCTLLTSPLFHVAGLHSTVCASMTVGTKLVMGAPKFDPEATMRLMAEERVTTWMAIPTLLSRFLDHPKLDDHDLSSLNNISTGGAPASPELLRRASELLPKKPNAGATYGLTEVHSMATSISSMEQETKAGSVGKPSAIIDIKIVNEAGEPVPTGVAGEICIGGCTVTPGYWNREDATAEAIREGWLHTGDVGYLDDDGYLFISDRAKDMILRGGENVYCVEIENVIGDHPDVAEAAVIGVPDKDMGERVKAVVRLHPGAELDADAIKAHVASHMAKFKVPEFVAFTDDELPRNAAGKLLKKQLRDA